MQMENWMQMTSLIDVGQCLGLNLFFLFFNTYLYIYILPNPARIGGKTTYKTVYKELNSLLKLFCIRMEWYKLISITITMVQIREKNGLLQTRKCTSI